MKRKCLVVGIILLFIGVAIAPSISARTNLMPTQAPTILEKKVSITVLEFRADGTIRKSVVILPRNQAKNLQIELMKINDFDSPLSIYKKYHLISQNVTDETLRIGMEMKAQRLGLRVERVQNVIAQVNRDNLGSNHTCENYHCQVDGSCIIGFRLLGGLSFFTSIPNGVLNHYHLWNLFLPSIDLMQVNFGYLGILHVYNGTYPDKTITGIIHFSLLIGFVGYYVSASPTLFFTSAGLYHGYAVACFGFIGAPTTEV